jgi:hypothetical protein
MFLSQHICDPSLKTKYFHYMQDLLYLYDGIHDITMKSYYIGNFPTIVVKAISNKIVVFLIDLLQRVLQIFMKLLNMSLHMLAITEDLKKPLVT